MLRCSCGFVCVGPTIRSSNATSRFHALLEAVTSSHHCCITLWTQRSVFNEELVILPVICHTRRTAISAPGVLSSLYLEQRSVFCCVFRCLLALMNYCVCNVSCIYQPWEVLVCVPFAVLTSTNFLTAAARLSQLDSDCSPHVFIHSYRLWWSNGSVDKCECLCNWWL